jgi:hypothetical protein
MFCNKVHSLFKDNTIEEVWIPKMQLQENTWFLIQMILKLQLENIIRWGRGDGCLGSSCSDNIFPSFSFLFFSLILVSLTVLF